MKTTRIVGPILCVLMLAGAASAQIVTVRHTMDYHDNHEPYGWESIGPFFIDPGLDPILDHSPWFRAMNQDWGWLHDIAGHVPFGATEIESAKLEIIAWGVFPPSWLDDPFWGEPRWATENHMVYVHPQPHRSQLGLLKTYIESPIQVPWPDKDLDTGYTQRPYYEEYFSITSFDLSHVIDHLWTTEQVYFFMDIDQMQDADAGKRVTLVSATLEIRYVVPGYVEPPPPVGPLEVDVHRFWSPVLGGHFYTSDEDEAVHVIDTWPDVWTYEGIGFRALANDSDPDARPVHRFWSDSLGGHFYTIDEDEVDHVIVTWPDVWTYEGVAFYAYPPDIQPMGAYPVYRFWSNTLGRHFYTIDEDEMLHVIETWPDVWTYEGIAWHALVPEF